LRSRSG